MQNIRVCPVDEKSWPRVKEILVNSLQDLKLYKLFCEDRELRHSFMSDYIEHEYQRSKLIRNSFFWYCQIDNPNCDDDLDFSNIFMAARLELPTGVYLSKRQLRHSDISTIKGAQEVIRFTNEQKHKSFQLEQTDKYPRIFKEFMKYRDWFKSFKKQLLDRLGSNYWEGCNIAVAPEYRNKGIAVSGIKKAMSTFSHLADEAKCKLLMANTGVPVCRTACKRAGFEEVCHYWYADIERWVMLASISSDKETPYSVVNSI